MNRALWTDRSVAGGLLVGSLLILLLAAIRMIAGGAIPGFAAMVQGSLAQAAPYTATFRLLIFLFVIAWLMQLLGLSLLTRLLLRAGSEQLAILAFTLTLVATILAVLYVTFRLSVDLWIAQEAATTAVTPALYAPLRAWISDSFKVATRAYHLAVAGFGFAIVRTRLLAPWVGWAAMAWSLFWLLGGLFGIGAPAIPLIMPAVIGVTLLREG